VGKAPRPLLFFFLSSLILSLFSPTLVSSNPFSQLSHLYPGPPHECSQWSGERCKLLQRVRSEHYRQIDSGAFWAKNRTSRNLSWRGLLRLRDLANVAVCDLRMDSSCIMTVEKTHNTTTMDRIQLIWRQLKSRRRKRHCRQWGIWYLWDYPKLLRYRGAEWHETLKLGTEMRPRRWPHQPRRDRDETFVGLKIWPRC